jgi:phosphoacetylglucosamine mutase
LITPTLINTDVETKELLNNDCGAEYVHKEVRFPTNFEKTADLKCCAFDGDADRLIYFTKDKQSKLVVIDGDKQFALISLYIKELLDQIGLEVPFVMVNTAYSNGKAV